MKPLQLLARAFALSLPFAGLPTFLCAGPENQAVQAWAEASANSSALTLRWKADDVAVPLAYEVQTKLPEASSWTSLASLPGSALSYVDASASPGVAHEYQIIKKHSTYTGYGYAQAGAALPAVESRGALVLIVEQSQAAALAPELARLRLDLVGDGWKVVRYDVPSTLPPPAVKSLVRDACAAFPGEVRSVLLFGHVAVPYSGQYAPDAHTDHMGAWPADAYYGDLDGEWTDLYVDYAQTANASATERARLTNVPGDGKFDQSMIPSAIELSVGRVDLSNLPAFAETETALLRRYLDKNHAYRHGLVPVAPRALAADYIGVLNGECFSTGAYSAFSSLVGASRINNLNATQPGLANVWLPTLASGTHLLAYGAGWGTYTGAQNIATTAGYAASAPQGVFTFLMGSYMGDWDTGDNLLRASLASPGLGLAAAWGGRPHWFLHSMATGGTIGDAARLTQNNRDTYRSITNSMANCAHIALMGDPSLRIHVVRPAADLRATGIAGGVALSWSPSPDATLGYHIYRSASLDGAFTRLNAAPVVGLAFTDAAPPASGAVYMVRPLRLETGAGGSYHNLGAGVFASTLAASGDDLAPPTVLLSSPASGTTITGSVTLSAAAWDDVGVASVRFVVDGREVGQPVTAAPYALSWDSATVANGTRFISALATDGSGRTRLSPAVAVTVSNIVSAPTSAGDTLWLDDALPAGASALTADGSAWTWVSAKPAPYSGLRAHETASASGTAENRLLFANARPVSIGDTLFVQVWIDPARPPRELMLAWRTGAGVEGSAHWGANLILRGQSVASTNRRQLGALPKAGVWTLLEVPADVVKLEGSTITRLTFASHGGRAVWDYAGVAAAAPRR